MQSLCPDEELLADFLEDRLSEEERLKVEHHLSQCDVCLEMIIAPNNLIHGTVAKTFEPVPDKVSSSAVRLVNDLRGNSPLFDSKTFRDRVHEFSSRVSEFLRIDPASGWAPQPVRRAQPEETTEVVVLKRIVQGIDVRLEIENTGKHGAVVSVQLPRDVCYKKQIRVALKRQGRVLTSRLVKDGAVEFEPINAGRYCLEFLHSGGQIGSCEFEIDCTDDFREDT